MRTHNRKLGREALYGTCDIDELTAVGFEPSSARYLSQQLNPRTHVCAIRIYNKNWEALIRTILLYGCETWPVRVEDLRRLEVVDNDCLRCLLRCCRRDRVPCASLLQRCSLHALPSVLLQRRLRWFGHASRRAPGEIIQEVICSTPLPTWRKRRGGGGN